MALISAGCASYGRWGRLLWALNTANSTPNTSKTIKNLSKHIKNHQNLPKCIKSHQKTTKSNKYHHKAIRMDNKPLSHRQNVSKPKKINPAPKYIKKPLKCVKNHQKTTNMPPCLENTAISPPGGSILLLGPKIVCPAEASLRGTHNFQQNPPKSIQKPPKMH